MNKVIHEIITILKNKTGYDFSGYRENVLNRRIQKRIKTSNVITIDQYKDILLHSQKELHSLIDVLTINVSEFFRNPLTFELLMQRILPLILDNKLKNRDSSLRIWSSACSTGEEPYSIAIIAHELMKKQIYDFDVTIFATDIDEKALHIAQKGSYPLESIKNVKYSHLLEYFSKKDNRFNIKDIIKKTVQFSSYDLLDKKSYAPFESIFGTFDLILCRNVLIYFDYSTQVMIYKKLHKSLTRHGVLVLGEAESPVKDVQAYYDPIDKKNHIYVKKEIHIADSGKNHNKK